MLHIWGRLSSINVRKVVWTAQELGLEIQRWWGLPLPRKTYAHLERWYAAMRSRPAAAGVLDPALS